MNKWVKSVISGLVIAALVFLLYHKLFSSGFKNMYKAHFLVKVVRDTEPGGHDGKDVSGDIPAILKQRFNDVGQTAKIAEVGNSRLDISVIHVHDTTMLTQNITQSNKIEFREVYTLSDIPQFFEMADKAVSRVSVPGNNEEKSIYSFLSPTIAVEREGVSKFPSAIGAVNKKDTAILRRILNQPVLSEALPPGLQFRYGILTDEVRLRNNPDDVRLFAIKKDDGFLTIQNDDIESAGLEFGDYSNLSTILIHFNRKGRQKWERITTENVGRYIAVLLDGIVLAAPVVNNPIHGSDIRMHTGLSIEQAREFSRQLTMGILPAHLSILQSEITPEDKENGWARVLVSLAAFVVTGALALLIFNSLKNR